MAFKFVVFACVLAAANAGLIAAPAATSYSSVSHAAPAYAYAAPAAHYSYAAPAASSYSTVSHAAPVPHYSYAAPAIKVAAPITYAAPIHKTIIAEPEAPAAYNFEYSVHDPHTGDVKSQKEVRNGDAVQGSYSLIEADGSKRIVEYTADDHNGFNAVVHREAAAHPVAVKAVAPIVKYAAPVATYAHAAPVAHYAAPVAHVAHAPVVTTHVAHAPVAHVAHVAPVVAHAPVAHYSAAPAVSYATFSAPTHVIHH